MAAVPSRRRLSRVQRRELILGAALASFSAEGYERAAMESIAARAGISKPVLYDHFEGKRELYVAVLEEQVAALRHRVLAPAESPAGTLEERFRHSARAALEFARERPEAWRLLFGEPATELEVAKAFGKMRARATDAVAEVIKASGYEPEGIDVKLAAQAVARMLMGALESLGEHALEHPAVELEVLLDIYMDITWVGVGQLARRSPSP